MRGDGRAVPGPRERAAQGGLQSHRIVGLDELASRGRCNTQRSCRDDYVCARIGDDTDGACLPAYFLFQLRVDGHPAPDVRF